MKKGILITLVVFIVITIIHFVSLRLLRLTEEKKRSTRKIIWYIYGTFFMITGMVNMIEKEKFLLFSFLESCFGLSFIILNFFGKIDKE